MIKHICICLLMVCMVSQAKAVSKADVGVIVSGAGLAITGACLGAATIIGIVRTTQNKSVDYQEITKKLFSKHMIAALKELHEKDKLVFYLGLAQLLSGIGVSASVVGLCISCVYKMAEYYE